jgi:glycosyltransferase involved in cell wall biosynthesis
VRLGNAPEPGRVYRFLWRRLIASGVNTFVPNSRFIERELLAHGIDPQKCHVVHNTVPHRDHPWASSLRVPGRVIFVGQIIPLKGLDLLLEAIAQLVAGGLDVSLDVVGATDRWESPAYAGYRDEVMRRASQPDLRGRVRFLGHREDVPRLLAEASVHCMPSRPEQKEGFAVALLEAKRSGLPSVVTACGALPEMVRHAVDGWICDDATPAALAAGLHRFLSDTEAGKRAGEAARQAERAYSRHRFVSEWREVFAKPHGHPAPVTAPHG